MTSIETPNFKAGIEILKKYEDDPEINLMGDNEWYVGNMCVWENKISQQEIEDLEMLGFHWYEEAECLLFNGEKNYLNMSNIHLEAPWNWGFGTLADWHIEDTNGNYIAEILSNGTDVNQAEVGTGFEIAKLIAEAPSMRDALRNLNGSLQNGNYKWATTFLYTFMNNLEIRLSLEE